MNPTPAQKSREAFEYDMRLRGCDMRANLVVPGSYANQDVQWAWVVWQSAHQCGREEDRAEVVARLRHDQAKFDLYNGPGMPFASAYVGELIAEFESVSPTGEKGSNNETVWGGS